MLKQLLISGVLLVSAVPPALAGPTGFWGTSQVPKVACNIWGCPNAPLGAECTIRGCPPSPPLPQQPQPQQPVYLYPPYPYPPYPPSPYPSSAQNSSPQKESKGQCISAATETFSKLWGNSSTTAQKAQDFCSRGGDSSCLAQSYETFSKTWGNSSTTAQKAAEYCR